MTSLNVAIGNAFVLLYEMAKGGYGLSACFLPCHTIHVRALYMNTVIEIFHKRMQVGNDYNELR